MWWCRMNKALIAVLLLVSCTRTPDTQPMQTQTQTAATVATGPSVVFPDGYTVQIEIAANEELRAQGLMFRDRLRPASGMLFFFPEDGEYPFWMKNTHIPLDMIWIDSGRRIVHITPDVPPCKIENCPSYPPHAIARYVLEVDAGVAKQHGLKNGDLLRFVGTENVVAQ
jgi:uncharacterized membrane protein (UPF0127 family)